MGLYDRDYSQYNDRQPRFGDGFASKPAWLIIIVINVVLFFLNTIFTNRTNAITDGLSIFGDTIYKPWLWWKFLTYGFAHDPSGIGHVLFNMIGLYFFGSAIERQLGRSEFTRFYLSSIIFGGVVGAIQMSFIGNPLIPLMGASGGVLAATLLFCFYYPQATILLMFVIPVKAWVMGVFFIVSNVLGAMAGYGQTAYGVHLAGIGFAYTYYKLNWNLAFLTPASLNDWKDKFSLKKTKLKLHDPDKKLAQEASEADRILEKIHRQGEESLTSGERKLLERYSRRVRNNRD